MTRSWANNNRTAVVLRMSSAECAAAPRTINSSFVSFSSLAPDRLPTVFA